MNPLQSRIERLERQAGRGQVDQAFVASLTDEDRAFYLTMRAREAAHPGGFKELVKTLTTDELEREISILYREVLASGVTVEDLAEWIDQQDLSWIGKAEARSRER